MSTNKQTPKLTPIKAIRKFMISYDIKPDHAPPIYYAWESKKQPKWYQTDDGIFPEQSYITVDYDKDKREWYIGYVIDVDRRYFATIDDITGRCDLMTIT